MGATNCLNYATITIATASDIMATCCSMSVSASECRYCAINDDCDYGYDDGVRTMNSGDADGGYCTIASDSFRSFGWEWARHGLYRRACSDC